MIVAEEKRKNNISEYILYMWQIEDLIRALKFDMNNIENLLVNNYQADEAKRIEIAAWYSNLASMLKKEHKIETGHLQVLVNLADDLNRFHQSIISEKADMEYIRLYEDIKNDIELVRNKSGKNHHDIEVSLNTLYLILMLKMKKQDVSEGTQKAVWKFGNFLAYLSKLYKAFDHGDFSLETYS